MDTRRTVILVNGVLPDYEAARRLFRDDDRIIAADGGTRHAFELGMNPHLVIGDLDSLGPEDKARLESGGTQFVAHPRGKDETDLELALRQALATDCRSILLLGALGGRLDQTLSNLALMTAPALSGIEIRIDDGCEAAWFVRSRTEVRGRSGEIVSLIPWGGPVEGAVTDGLRWKLDGETLYPHEARGISNELVVDNASIRIESGLLLVIHRRTF